MTANENKGRYTLPGDRSVTRAWFAPLSFVLFGLLFVAIRYVYVSSDYQSTAYLLGYVLVGFGVLPYLASFVARFGDKVAVPIVVLKIFGAPFLFLGFLIMLVWLS